MYGDCSCSVRTYAEGLPRRDEPLGRSDRLKCRQNHDLQQCRSRIFWPQSQASWRTETRPSGIGSTVASRTRPCSFPKSYQRVWPLVGPAAAGQSCYGTIVLSTTIWAVSPACGGDGVSSAGDLDAARLRGSGREKPADMGITGDRARDRAPSARSARAWLVARYERPTHRC